MDAVKTIPGFENFNSSALPTVEQGADLAKQKCEKNGGEGAFERAKKGAEIAAECLKNQINTTALQEEMEIARPKGELDTVFKKYCGRTPEVKSCVWNFTETAKPCLEEEERNNVKIIMNITEALLDFICHKEGDRIACLFFDFFSFLFTCAFCYIFCFCFVFILTWTNENNICLQLIL